MYAPVEAPSFLSQALSADQAASDVSDSWQLNRAALRHTFCICMHALTMLTAVRLQSLFHPTVVSAGGHIAGGDAARCSLLGDMCLGIGWCSSVLQSGYLQRHAVHDGAEQWNVSALFTHRPFRTDVCSRDSMSCLTHSIVCSAHF